MSLRRAFSLLLMGCMLFSIFALASCEKKGATETTATGTEPVGTEPEATGANTTEAETTAATTERPAPEPNVYYSFQNNQEYIKLLGRSRYYRSAVVLDWTAAGLEFEFEGSGDLKMNVEFSGGRSATLTVEVDGTARDVAVEGSGTIRIASGLADGVHHVRVRRRTRVANDTKGLLLMAQGVTMTGYFLERPADNTYKVAFLGDSITCGEGLTGTNGLLTYAVDLCTREGFDYDICAVSGIGVCRTYKKDGYSENTMTKFYPFFNYFRSETLRYLPDRRADLVIVNLNTNDSILTTATDDAEYKGALKTLITEIRDAHGTDVPILWIVGMMISPNSQVNRWLNDVFAELGGENAGLYQITVETNTSGDQNHPNQDSHLAVSQALSAYIRAKNLLDLSPLTTPSAE